MAINLVRHAPALGPPFHESKGRHAHPMEASSLSNPAPWRRRAGSPRQAIGIAPWSLPVGEPVLAAPGTQEPTASTNHLALLPTRRRIQKVTRARGHALTFCAFAPGPSPVALAGARPGPPPYAS